MTSAIALPGLLPRVCGRFRASRSQVPRVEAIASQCQLGPPVLNTFLPLAAVAWRLAGECTMLSQMIRRMGGVQAQSGELAIDSMVFSLTTQVPRPTENRIDERLATVLPVARLIADGWQDFCRIRNMS